MERQKSDKLPGWWGGLLGMCGWSLLAAVLLAAAWLDPRFFPATWLGIAIVLRTTRICGVVTGTVWAYATFLLALSCAFWWAPQSLEFNIGCSFWVALLIAAILAMVEALQPALAILLFSWARHRLGWSSLLTLPLIWVAIEFFWPKVCPWILGHSQVGWLPMLQIAELTGGFGVSAVTLVCGVVLVRWGDSLKAWRGGETASGGLPQPAGSGQKLDLGIGLAVLVLTLSFGCWRVYQLSHSGSAAKNYRVALLQVDPSFTWSIPKLQEMTRELQAEEHVDLVCWPETSFGTYDRELMDFSDAGQVTRNSRRPELGLRPNADSRFQMLGAGKSYPRSATFDGPYYVTAYLFDAEQKVLGRYDKQILMPTGEYVPFQEQFPQLKEIFNIVEIYHRGADSRPLLDGQGVRLGVLICYEDMSPRLARETTAAGADVLVCLINGNAFENPVALWQHRALAMLRSIECRRPLVRCAATGLTCVIGPDGRTVAKIPVRTTDFLVADVPLQANGGETIYVRFGDWFAWACVAVAGLLLLVAVVLPGRRELASAAR